MYAQIVHRHLTAAGVGLLPANAAPFANPPAHLDAPGDSVVVPPPGLGLPLSVSAIVTAPAGSELSYICAFHPWMQGTIHVLPPSDPDTDN